MRKTKIVCTIGPASCDEQTLTGMCLAGMNVARINFSHGTHPEQHEKIETIKRVREKLNLPVAIMLDTKGPEYRIRTFKEDKVELKDGQAFTFTTRDIVGDEHIVSVSYEGLADDLQVGDHILLSNALLDFEVESIEDTEIHCRVLTGGTLSNRKSMNFPNRLLKMAYLSDQDKADIRFGIEHDVDFIACSFVSTQQDLLDVKAFLRENGGAHISLIAKIENRAGIDNIESICKECEGIMIGRGDLGAELPYEELPAAQKDLITKCRLLGKRVITATEMLESMIYNMRPTRAEVSDVANAVYDGSSAVMLSGETAAGKYPVGSVQAMAKIVERTEQNIDYVKRFRSTEFKINSVIDAISHATCGMAIDVEAKGIVACSLSGSTVRMVSRFRPPVDIVGLTVDERTWRSLALSWGVTPVLCDEYPSTEVLFYIAKLRAGEVLDLKKDDRIVITGGVTTGKSGTTNLIKVENI